MAFSTYLANKILDHVLRNTSYTPPATVYLSLHTADPGNTGANECSGGSYARVSCAFNSASAKAAANTSQTDVLMSAQLPTHWGLWDASTTGNFLMDGTLSPNNVTYNSGDTARFAAGAITHTLT